MTLARHHGWRWNARPWSRCGNVIFMSPCWRAVCACRARQPPAMSAAIVEKVAIMTSSAIQQAPQDRPDEATEQRRLAEVSRYAITLDQSDPNLDVISSLAVKTLDADIGGISIVYQSQIWLPSRVGVDARHVPRSCSFCTWVVAAATERDFFEVEDAHTDPRFNTNPLVTYPPHYRHYAAVPLLGARGYLLGTLWVMGTRSRRLDVEQQLDRKSVV